MTPQLGQLDLDDSLNRDIWEKSPVLQDALRDRHRNCALVAAQAIEDGTPLPWVPDLVGRRWREPGSVIIFGSAYADFFTSFARRGARMDAAEYRGETAAAFQRTYLRRVVEPDPAYYRKVGALVDALGLGWDQVVLTDLVRASLVVMRNGASAAGDRVLRESPTVAHEHLRVNAIWHKRRLEDMGGDVVISLGQLAHRGVLALLGELGWTARDGGRVPVGQEWLSIATTPPEVAMVGPSGRGETVVQVPHPSAWGQDPMDAAAAVRAVMAGRGAPEARARVASPTRRPLSGSRRRTSSQASVSSGRASSREALWAMAFVTANPLPAARELAKSPKAALHTQRLVRGMSASRMVAIANALYNPCRPGNHDYRTQGVEAGWAKLLSRRNQPYSRENTKWSRLVRALEPVPPVVLERLAKMDILELGAVARGLIQGPYKEM